MGQRSRREKRTGGLEVGHWRWDGKEGRQGASAPAAASRSSFSQRKAVGRASFMLPRKSWTLLTIGPGP